MGLLIFKNIPLSRKLQSRFDHRCTTRRPLGLALFALAIHEVTSKIKADLNTWYLDDGCIDHAEVAETPTRQRPVSNEISDFTACTHA